MSSSSSSTLGARYICDKPSFVLPPIEQDGSFSGAAAAATIRQIDYQLRMQLVYSTNSNVNEGVLFHHDNWLQSLRSVNQSINPLMALQFAENVGVACVNGTLHKISRYVALIGHDEKLTEEVKFDRINRCLDNKIPVIVLFKVDEHYPKFAEKPYPLKQYDPKNQQHAVVIIGIYVAGKTNEHDLAQGTYLLYQESRGHPEHSLLGNGVGILNPGLVDEAYYGISELPGVLLNEKGIENQKIIEEMEEQFRKEIAKEARSRSICIK